MFATLVINAVFMTAASAAMFAVRSRSDRSEPVPAPEAIERPEPVRAPHLAAA